MMTAYHVTAVYHRVAETALDPTRRLEFSQALENFEAVRRAANLPDECCHYEHFVSEQGRYICPEVRSHV